MDGFSPKGEPKFNLPSSARSLLQDEYKEAFDRLQEHCGFLDQKIASLTHKFLALENALKAEQRIREALEEELATQKNQSKQPIQTDFQFLDNMSHELRTPLNGILGMAQLMLDLTRSPEIQEHTLSILESGKHLERIIGSLLDYSKLQNSELPLETEEFNVRQLLEDICSSYANEAHQKSIGLYLDVDKSVNAHIVSDRQRIRQVIEILLDNALKFTTEGNITLKANIVTIEEDDQQSIAPTPMLSIWVQDTGIGFSKDQLTSIYQPFWQADNSNARKYGGLGIGLALCKSLVTHLGGTIQHQSDVGDGTTGFISLPLDELITLQPAEVPEEIKQLTVGFYHLDKTNQSILSQHFASLGISLEKIDDLEKLTARTPAVDVLLVQHKEDLVQSLQNYLNTSRKTILPILMGITHPISSLPASTKDILLALALQFIFWKCKGLSPYHP